MKKTEHAENLIMSNKVSIIIPVFNDQAGLDMCLHALNRQEKIDSEDVEVLVIDNGSAPPLTIPRDLSIGTQLLRCLKPGSYAARNTGVSASEGEILAFIDADCRPSKTWVAAGISALNTQPNGIIGGEVTFELSSAPSYVELYQSIVGFAQETNIRERRFSKTANLFVRKSTFLEVGVFREDLLSCGDAEWCWRAEDCGKTIGFSAAAIAYTAPRKSILSAVTQMRRIAGGRESLKKLHPNRDDRHTAPALQNNKSLSSRIKTIWEASHLSASDRIGVLCVAALIRIAYLKEALWLTLGSKPERR